MFATKAALAILFISAFFCLLNVTTAVPALGAYHNGLGAYGKRFDNSIDYFVQICLNNCAQCKKMYGDYFKGQACGDSCLRFEGRAIPDCEDIGSIAPFLNRLD